MTKKQVNQKKDNPPILFRTEFVNYLMHKRKLTIEEALQYIRWLNDVNECFHMDIVSDIYNLAVHVYRDLTHYLRSRLPESDANNCIKALKTYSQFIEKVILTNETFPDQSIAYVEGATLTVKVNRFERSQKAREICISHHGTTCKVCDLNFFQTYGALGDGFIHVHHIVPLNEICKEYEVNPVNDLVPVCPNCHAMLHRGSPTLTVDQLKKILHKN